VEVGDKKRPQAKPPGVFFFFRSMNLYLGPYHDNVRRLGTLRTVGNFELYFIALVKDFEPILLDGGEVNEDIISAVAGNESEALLLIKPFYTTFGHYNSPPLFYNFGKL